jgi:photosystem II stability/assembly factor-like uncharacterized protein
MKQHTSSLFRPGNATAKHKPVLRGSLCLLLSMLILMLASCNSSWNNNIPATATSTDAKVNGFGTAANHPHSLLVLPNNVLVLATHYGTFRSNDGGTTWKQVAGGPGQPMDGLMSDHLSLSSLDPQRIYVVTQPALSNAKGTLGLYTSHDQGQTWHMAIAASKLTPNQNIYLTEAGNATPDQVYVYLPARGATGLMVSMDDGQNFSATGPLPFGNLTSLLPIPGAKNHLLAGSNDGLAESTDGGQHWTTMPGIQGGIFQIVTSGPNQPIYATGDNGLYVSYDGGKSFATVNTQVAYGSSLAVSPTQPQTLYGHTAVTVYRSTDGGKTWNALPLLKKQLFNLVVDPHNAQQVYLDTSYPVEMYHFTQASQTWSSLTPKP